MQGAIDILHSFSIETEVKVVSAHRTPKAMVEYAESALERGIKVIIAGAGGAAHLRHGSFFNYLTGDWRPLSNNSIDGWDSVRVFFKCLQESL